MPGVATLRVATADTGATPNTSGAFTPATGDYLIVFCPASGTLEGAATCTSTSGVTFTFISNALFQGGSGEFLVFRCDALVTAGQAVSQTVTVNCPTDPSTGTNIIVYSISNTTGGGATGWRQSAGSNRAAGLTPNPTFAANCLATNVVVGCIANSSNPAGMTPPSGWTETAGGDIGYGSPTTGAAACHIDSGFTGTTVTWGSTSATESTSFVVEFNIVADATLRTLPMMGCGLG